MLLSNLCAKNRELSQTVLISPTGKTSIVHSSPENKTGAQIKIVFLDFCKEYDD